MKPLVLVRFLVRQYPVPLLLAAGGLLLLGVVWYVRKPANPMNWQLAQGYGIRFPMRYSVHGLDVSRHNNRIDWSRVAAMNNGNVTMQFAFMKATEGATLSDPTFAQNWKEARRVGLRRGAYHFYHPTRDPLRQAANFIRRVTLQPGDFAPVLDFEVTNNVPDAKIVADLRLFLAALEDHYHLKPIIYTNPNLYKRFIQPNFEQYPLWIADYSKRNLDRYDPDRLYLWQHNKSGWVQGISGLVDLNTFVMDTDRINDLCLD